MAMRISATDWVADGFTPEDSVEVAKAFRKVGLDVLDVSTGGATPDARPPFYGRMYQVPFSDRIRNEAGLATMAVGNISDWDQVNTILAAGRADLVVLAREHLRNPYFTLLAAAEQGHSGLGTTWPNQYGSVRPPPVRLG